MFKKTYNFLFSSRTVFCFFIIIFLFLSCVLRVAVISTGNYNSIQTQQSEFKIDVAKLRGTIYDCNMVPLTNVETEKMAVVLPTPRSIMSISRVLEGDILNNTLDTLKKNKPALCLVNEDLSCDGIETTTIYKRYGKTLSACHLLGYVDASGHGVSGLELAYDDILFSKESVTAIVNTDGKGNALKGVSPYFRNDLTQVFDGVVTTLDINIQTITENSVSKLNSGCAIVAEVGSGKIRAMASVPTFDVNDIAKSLNAENAPMLNRALCSYNIGSVFKPCIAIAAIENGYTNEEFVCEGSLEIGDRHFRCHNLNGHGTMNLCTSLAQSCNCFFYNFATMLGGHTIYKTAAKFSLGFKIKLADNLFTAKGNLPYLNEFSNSGTLANLSIGQGNLMASPVSMLNLYLAIAGDGSYRLPSVVEKTINEGVESPYDSGSSTKVMNSNTASLLREYLKTVITDGTGVEAAPTYTTAAGKTGTAQTGRYYKSGEEITNSWFCGFFPYDNPQYVVVVMSDSKLNVSTASIFAQIADGITEYKGINVENND
ncbi:MAG: penicillin-binding protein 2 [Ruminococcaceae bacterium]|nr:penicillin-binding protein 2 [Oscillospiraceae bacterium]